MDATTLRNGAMHQAVKRDAKRTKRLPDGIGHPVKQ